VNVKYGPDNIVLHNLPEIAVKGQSAMFNCTADGNPTPMYTWLLNGTLVVSEQTFSIRNVSYANAGQYTCVAKNTIDDGISRTDNASAYMKVEGRPQNCNILNVESPSSSFLSLTVRCFNGYSPITGCLVQVKKITSRVWQTRNITVIDHSREGLVYMVLTNLDANTFYDVRVKARNKHGYEEEGVLSGGTTMARTAEEEPSTSQCPIGLVAGAFAAGIVILIVIAIKINFGLRRQLKSTTARRDDSSGETTQMTKSAVYDSTQTAHLPRCALKSNSDDKNEIWGQESYDRGHDYEELPGNTKEKETEKL
jgi:hypothetical protein